MPDTENAPVTAPAHPDLGAMRTLMAADRSLMAWVRTALSMITFGFTIYNVLRGVKASGAADVGDPRTYGLFLMGLGVLSLVMGSVEYATTLRDLRVIATFRIWRPAMLIAAILSVAGFLLFLSILVRVV